MGKLKESGLSTTEDPVKLEDTERVVSELLERELGHGRPTVFEEFREQDPTEPDVIYDVVHNYSLAVQFLTGLTLDQISALHEDLRKRGCGKNKKKG